MSNEDPQLVTPTTKALHGLYQRVMPYVQEQGGMMVKVVMSSLGRSTKEIFEALDESPDVQEKVRDELVRTVEEMGYSVTAPEFAEEEEAGPDGV